MDKNVGGDGDGITCILKYKRRKVSAIRDFPKGCGCNAPQITLKLIKDTSAANGPKAKPDLGCHDVFAHELQKSKNFELKTCPSEFAADSQLQIACIPSVSIVPSQPENLIMDTNLLVKIWHGKFPPRRRTSAFRTFPINFIRNASEHSKDERIKAQAHSSTSCRSLTHVGAENKVEKSNQPMKVTSVESEKALKAESNISCKLCSLISLNSDEKLHCECQACKVLESHESSSSCSIRASEERRLPHSTGTSRDEKSDSENQNVASNGEVPKLDGELGNVTKNPNFGLSLENEAGSEIAVHNEEKKGLISESLHSTEIREDEVNINALRAVPSSVKITDLEDDCSLIKFSSKILDSSAIPNCPWRHNEVVNLSSPGGQKKSFHKRRVLTSLSKRRNVRTNLKENYPYVTVGVEDNEKSFSGEDKKNDGDNSSPTVHGAVLALLVPTNARMHNAFNDCISHGKVRETSHQTLYDVRESMQKDKGNSIVGATGDPRWDDQGENINISTQKRMPAPVQPELASKSNLSKRSKRSHFRHGICNPDISDGRETIPIRAINTIDDQQPPFFKYITRVRYPDWCRPLPLIGCKCIGDCSYSPECSCAVRNGGEIPFDSHGCLVERKPLVYECGPSCKCPLSCPNRVSQLGVRYQLEIFKTESRGWGVRSRNFIPSGGFICEYMGELLEDKQAEQRIDNDEYLFDIGSNISKHEDKEVVDDAHFTIDGQIFGNVGRFINHCCSPNSYAQDVLYDHENKRIPHVMFFAGEDIPPLQELTYDYNYHIGDVSDTDGNMKSKQCLCGSEECIGWLY